jgi:hypothetical protein
LRKSDLSTHIFDHVFIYMWVQLKSNTLEPDRLQHGRAAAACVIA